MASDKVIVKVQKPVITTDAFLPWLVYKKGRKRQQEIPDFAIPRHVREHFERENILKAFYYANWGKQGWELLDPAPWQN